MKLRRDLLISVVALVALNLLVALGAIVLLSRMSPAIERILEENVVSIEAAEEMLALLAQGRGMPLGESERARFAEALIRAENNLTEDDEIPVLTEMRQSWPGAVEGEAVASDRLVSALRQLVSINRNAMLRIDERAKRMGVAGAWAGVFMGLLGFVASLGLIRRLRDQIMSPLAELYTTLEAARRGDSFRRCSSVHAPGELRSIFQSVNLMLDREHVAAQRSPDDDGREAVRVTLEHLLDLAEAPAYVVDACGEIVAANRDGLELLEGEGEGGLREALAQVPSGRRSELLEVTPIGEGEAWYCLAQRPDGESVEELPPEDDDANGDDGGGDDDDKSDDGDASVDGDADPSRRG
ncbi:hypothetical protein [Haliangium ochraceum]|uniref:Histidine kinase HAMP region domain protein n=1 Tax=Haliangium ochraceum (strain DSM 14365 / JCM 11303 / SMP-2) TaxID=502025 RepID=D0LJG4_HALO1|nr:hypothetical protein [Haliangium ochraceum]ACY16538.1 histidine kinase HAMP region domain protein [Haliangium ochraceum DSM 14365]